MDYFSLTIYGLQIFSLFVLIKLLIFGDTIDKNLQKTFGGLIVLLCALASKNPYAITTSIFIGGLIIASEDFMKFLAAILKTNSDKVSDTITAFLQLQTKTEKEIEGKNEEEIKEINEIENKIEEIKEISEVGATNEIENKIEENVVFSSADYKKLIPKIEDAALKKIQLSLGRIIKRNLSFSGIKFIFDGVLVDNDKKVLKFFEVKVFPKLPVNKNGKVMTFVMVDSIKNYLRSVLPVLDEHLSLSAQGGFKHTLTVIVVFNTNSELKKIKQKIRNISIDFGIICKNIEINYVFYNIKNINLDLDD